MADDAVRGRPPRAAHRGDRRLTSRGRRAPSAPGARTARRVAVATLLAGAACTTSDARTREAAHGLALAPCILVGARDVGRCGTLDVPEDRARPDGRRIGLRIAVLPARGRVHAAEPIVVLTGGPGAAGTALDGWSARELAPLRATHDIVLVDQRGTGASNPLACALYDDRLQSSLDPAWPAARVAACAARLAARADLARYGTADAADDLDALREALGAARVDVVGISYGSRVALTYLRRHPAHVRRAVLLGPTPPQLPVPSAAGWAGARALDRAAAACIADDACRAAAPDPAGDVARLMARLERAPLSLTVWSWRRLARERVTLTARGTAERLWSMLYSPGGARRMLALVHAAVQGDAAPLARAMIADARGRRRRSVGMQLAVLCAEDAPRLAALDTARLGARPPLGAPMVAELLRACRAWPRTAAPADAAAPVRADVPVLILSGGRDPVSPPEWGAEAARWLPHAVHLVNPDAGHAEMGDCERRTVAAFVRGSPDAGGAPCLPTFAAWAAGEDAHAASR